MAYFPNCLIDFYVWREQARTRKPFSRDQVPKLKTIIKELYSKNYNEPHLFSCDHDPGNFDDIAALASYEYCINPDLRKTMLWISTKILSTVGKDNYLTVNVYIRIATSMINKLVDKNIISKEFGIHYHDNLVANTNALISAINTEDLPF